MHCVFIHIHGAYILFVVTNISCEQTMLFEKFGAFYHTYFGRFFYMCVEIVELGLYTSDIVIGTGIVYCTWSRSWAVVWGCLAISCVVVGDSCLYWWWPLAVAGEVWEFHVFS